MFRIASRVDPEPHEEVKLFREAGGNPKCLALNVAAYYPGPMAATETVMLRAFYQGV